MNSQRVLGVLLLAAGVVLFIIGLNASESLADQWSEFFTGHFTDSTVWYMVGGIASVCVGVMLFVFGGRRLAA